ncbi:Crp/Fnr family transcriptional regulator [Variovorax ureilyticus]|uniref:Crp/Fnr family transcriptional regulator n=1 Tax=Variovorax ureilyticus TaxID=1836198 RepID=A0ABU8VL39_9BURK
MNHLLAALPETVRNRWAPLSDRVEMQAGVVLCEPGSTVDSVYFPISAIVALMYGTRDGELAEVAIVGNEGVVGISSFMGGGSTPSRAVVQCPGQFIRIPARVVKAEFDESAETRYLLLRYAQALMSQIEQIAVCNRFHSVDQQLCRWLLVNMDSIQASELAVTQDLMADMLGVRRESVCETEQNLQKAGLISRSRGRVRVLDRAGLEHRACECYRVVKKEYERLLGAH